MPINRGHILLPIARAAIAREFGQALAVDETADWLHEPGASFVTLTQHGQLRGCIGSLEAHRSLLADVKANARAAAFHDPRFPPLAETELGRTEIEVSLLSPMQDMVFGSERDALAQLRPGMDGIALAYGHFHSTFLPQVWEQLPDPADFMAHLKQKAGLPSNFWDQDIKLSRYTVSKWKERDQEVISP